jgi:hypothetical protein
MTSRGRSLAILLVCLELVVSGIVLLDNRHSFELTVHYFSERPEVAPLFIPKSKVGAQLSIPCQVLTGTKPVSFLWRKNNEVMEHTGIKVDANDGYSSLKLTNISISDRGSYSCTAKNSFGEDTKTAELEISGESLFFSF